jgi:hypothetical protein
MLSADAETNDAADRIKTLLQDRGIIFKPW